MGGDILSRIDDNARVVLRYFEVFLPKIEPGGGVPDSPMNRKERGTTRPPVSDYVMELWEKNPDLGKINEMVREAALQWEDKLLGRKLWLVLGDVLFDHRAIRAWRAKGEESLEMKRLWLLCYMIADRLQAKHDAPGSPLRLELETNPKADPVVERPEMREKGHSVKRDSADQRRTIDAHDSYRKIVEGLERLEDEKGYSREAAKSKKARDLMCSVPRIEKAITFVNKERRGDVA